MCAPVQQVQLLGIHPPGKKDDPFTMVVVIKNMLVAHTQASNAIRAASAKAAAQPTICLAMSHILFTAAPGYSPMALLSAIVAVVASYLFNYVYADALVLGRAAWPVQLLSWLLGWSSDLRALKGTVDVLGINHYYRSVVSFETNDGTRTPGATDLFIPLPLGLALCAMPIDGFEKSDMGWDLTPSSMEALLSSMWKRYRFPLLVTESGIADGDEPDDRRTRYLTGCLGVAHALLQRGVDLRGYLLWTLLDNFEWAEGFRPRFGLLHTNFDTFERRTRQSNAVLKSVLGPR